MSAITEIAREKKAKEPDELELVRDALGGEYEIIDELGRGGMAVVYRAMDLNLDREVAIKVLPLSMAYDDEFIQRFQREAKTAAKLEHPNIIPIHRVGKSGRIIYFVMKFLRGRSVADILDERGPIPPAEIRQILTEAGSALGYAHANGVVHRDIKPDNILFDKNGRAIVMDFGIAKAAAGTRLTHTGMAIGTPYYMSPEQARAQELDGRSDIYSLGVVAYQCLCGKVPFEGDDSFAVGIKHISEEIPVPPLETDEQKDLFKIVQKMLAKEPEERYQSVDELLTAIGASTEAGMPTIAAGPPVHRPLHSAGLPLAASETPTTPMPKMAKRAPDKPKKKLSGALMATLAVLVVSSGSVLLYSSLSSSGEDEADSAIAASDSTGDSAIALADSMMADSAAAQSDSAIAVASVVVRQQQTTATQGTTQRATPDTTPSTPRQQRPRARQPAVSPRAAARTRWVNEVQSRLQGVTEEMASGGYELEGNPRIGRLADDATEDFEASLATGFEYIFGGMCDDGCEDIDLILYGPRNREVDSDYALDANPVVQVRPRATSTHRVRVSMANCQASSCYYAVALYKRSGQARRGRKR